MKIRIKKQHLDKADYISNTDCPFARALKDLRYKNVQVGGTFADAQKDGKRFFFEFNFGASAIKNAQRRGNKPFTVTVTRTQVGKSNAYKSRTY